MGAALDVARKELDAGEQATDSAHVIVAVAAYFIAHAVLRQHTILERCQRLEARLERLERSLLVGPEVSRDDAIGAEQNDQPLLAPLLVGEPEAGQVEHERQSGRANSQVAKEFAARSKAGHRSVSGRGNQATIRLAGPSPVVGTFTT